MSTLTNISLEVLQLVAQRMHTSVDELLLHMGAQIMGFVQHWSIIGGAAKANTVLEFNSLDGNVKKITPKLEQSILRIQASVSFSGTAPKIKVDTYVSGNQLVKSTALGNSAFVTIVGESFDFQVSRGQQYTLEFDQDCTIDHLIICEIPVNS